MRAIAYLRRFKPLVFLRSPSVDIVGVGGSIPPAPTTSNQPLKNTARSFSLAGPSACTRRAVAHSGKVCRRAGLIDILQECPSRERLRFCGAPRPDLARVWRPHRSAADLGCRSFPRPPAGVRPLRAGESRRVHLFEGQSSYHRRAGPGCRPGRRGERRLDPASSASVQEGGGRARGPASARRDPRPWPPPSGRPACPSAGPTRVRWRVDCARSWPSGRVRSNGA